MPYHRTRPKIPGHLLYRIGIGLLLCCGASLGGVAHAQAPGASPASDDPAVQAVLAQRQRAIEAMMAGTMSAETERYSTAFVANSPGGVVSGDTLLRMFTTGSLRYTHVEQQIEYAASHGPDLVVIMGEEIVVPGPGMANAGRRVHRRFTDVFRREQGEWRHDVRHANVLSIEER